jgi:hypothetical protein
VLQITTAGAIAPDWALVSVPRAQAGSLAATSALGYSTTSQNARCGGYSD